MMEKLTNFNDNYLDISVLEEGKRYTKVALVTNTTSGITKYDSNFFTFMIKDINANTVRAQLFNVANAIEKGFTSIFLRGKPVTITFITQIYNGQLSLILEDISLYTDNFDYSLFIGRVNVNADRLKLLAKQLTNDEVIISLNFANTSLSFLCGGKCGGFLKLFDSTIKALYAYADFPGININDLLKVCLYTMPVYFDYLEMKDKFPIINQDSLFSLLHSLEASTSKNPLQYQITDTARALLEVTRPQHIYSHLIVKAVKSLEEQFNLITINNTLTKGTLTRVGDSELIRY